MKSFIIFLIIIFLNFVFSFFFNFLFTKNYPAVIFLDIGQGDSILLRNIEGRNILIDGGPDNLVLKKLGKYLPYFSRRLDLIIISHSHDDHVLGLIETITRYKADYVFLGDGFASSQNQDLFLSKIEEENSKNKEDAEVVYIDDNLELKFSDSCHLSVLNPLILKIKENENNSLIAKLECGDLKFLFSGDAEREIEEKLLEYNYDLGVDVLKAGHHGSKTSNTLDFLKASAAKFFVVSSGRGNRFNHPAPEVIERARSLGMSIRRTDIEGDIIFPLNLID